MVDYIFNIGDPGLIWVGMTLWRRQWQSTPVFLPGESHGQRSLAGHSPVQFSRPVMSDSLPPHESQHARPACPSPTPGVDSNMSIKSVMLSSHLILCRPLLLLPPIPPSIRVFSSESSLRMRWPKYWSFSFSVSPSSEHPGLISFRMDWLDLLADSQESFPKPQFKSMNFLALSFLHSPNLTSMHDLWKNHSLD